jgi:hypothetical protein
MISLSDTPLLTTRSLGLSPFLQGKLVERLKQEAAKRE